MKKKYTSPMAELTIASMFEDILSGSDSLIDSDYMFDDEEDDNEE